MMGLNNEYEKTMITANRLRELFGNILIKIKHTEEQIDFVTVITEIKGLIRIVTKLQELDVDVREEQMVVVELIDKLNEGNVIVTTGNPIEECKICLNAETDITTKCCNKPYCSTCIKKWDHSCPWCRYTMSFIKTIT